jgi:hypothetical protein
MSKLAQDGLRFASELLIKPATRIERFQLCQCMLTDEAFAVVGGAQIIEVMNDEFAI